MVENGFHMSFRLAGKVPQLIKGKFNCVAAGLRDLVWQLRTDVRVMIPVMRGQTSDPQLRTLRSVVATLAREPNHDQIDFDRSPKVPMLSVNFRKW